MVNLLVCFLPSHVKGFRWLCHQATDSSDEPSRVRYLLFTRPVACLAETQSAVDDLQWKRTFRVADCLSFATVMDDTNRALPVLFGLVAASAANGVTAALRATASAAMRFDLIWSLLRSGLATEANRASRRDSVWIGGGRCASPGLCSTRQTEAKTDRRVALGDDVGDRRQQ